MERNKKKTTEDTTKSSKKWEEKSRIIKGKLSYALFENSISLCLSTFIVYLYNLCCKVIQIVCYLWCAAH